MAKLRDAGFRWDASTYEKSRGSTADVDMLLVFKAALLILLTFGYTGFPAHGNVRNTLLKLQEEFAIFDGQPKFHYKLASEAAGKWRRIAKIYELKRDEKRP